MDLPDADVSTPNAFDNLPKTQFDRVYHLAGKTFIPDSWKDPDSFYRANLIGTLNVLEYCRKTGSPLTYVSAYLYGLPKSLPINETATPQPDNPYAHSKFLAEELCLY